MSTPTCSEEVVEEFHFMITLVAKGLKIAECERIVYLKGLPKDTCSPNQEKHDVKLFTLVTLEARGIMSALNPDPLRTLLVKIDRQDLTRHIDDYLSKRMALMKKMEKERKKSMKKQKNKKGDNTDQQPQHQLEPASKELFAIKAASSSKEQLKRLQTLTLSYITRLMEKAQALHAVIHDDDSTESCQQQKVEACQAVVTETEKFDHRFRKVLSAAGLSSSKDSNSSEESGVGMPDRRKDSDSPMQHQLQFPITEQGSRQPNSTAYIPLSVGVEVMPKNLFHQKPTACQTTHVGSDDAIIVSGSRTPKGSRKGPPPPPKPKPTHTQHSMEAENAIYSTPGSGDSGVYITHSLPSLLDEPDDQPVKVQDQGLQYENIATQEEHLYEPLEDLDRGSANGVRFKLPMRARASSMDDKLF